MSLDRETLKRWLNAPFPLQVDERRLLAEAISAGVNAYVDVRERIKRLQRDIETKKEEINRHRGMIGRLEGFLAKYGDEERRTSIELLKLRIKWGESDIEMLEGEKVLLTEMKGRMKEALIKCGIELKEW